MTDLASLQRSLNLNDGGQAPMEKWQPQNCGALDMRIDSEGQWHYMGSPIGRQALVKLFARVVWREGEQYFLMTPVEKIAIQVDDVPFIVNDWQWHALGDSKALQVTTNVGDTALVGLSHPLQLREYQGNLLPYVRIRRNLWARVHRNVYYQWINEASSTGTQLTLQSAGYQLLLGEID